MNMSSVKCKYKNQYNITKKHITKIFQCDNDALESGLCKFHDITYLTETTQDDLDSCLIEKLKDSIKTKKELVCVGYHIANMSVIEKFSESVYFDKVVFHGEVHLDNSEFEKDIQFSKCVFEKDVSFTGSVFLDEVDFSGSTFHGSQVAFQLLQFSNKVNFSKSEFPNVFFTTTKFRYVDFSNSIFNGSADFWRSEFNDGADFNNSI